MIMGIYLLCKIIIQGLIKFEVENFIIWHFYNINSVLYIQIFVDIVNMVLHGRGGGRTLCWVVWPRC